MNTPIDRRKKPTVYDTMTEDQGREWVVKSFSEGRAQFRILNEGITGVLHKLEENTNLTKTVEAKVDQVIKDTGPAVKATQFIDGSIDTAKEGAIKLSKFSAWATPIVGLMALCGGILAGKWKEILEAFK